MDNNVAPFEDFESVEQIGAHQVGLPRVILEGQTDVELFSRFWFASLKDTFDFIEAKLVAGGGAGCTGVDAAVEFSRQQSIPAVGIIDRDTFFQKSDWDLLYSVAAATLPADWTTTRVYITSRWEVEAYVLEPDALSPWVTVAHREPPGSPAECARALSRTLVECEALLAASPYLAAQHAGGVKVPPGFLYNVPLETVIKVCNEKIALSPEAAQAVAAKVQHLVQAILDTQPDEVEQKLVFLLRYVDTKRLFNRLQHALNLRDAHWVHLAEPMRTRQRPPAELAGVLKSFEDGLLVA